MGRLEAVCISEKKGTLKKDIKEVTLIENHGLENDAHAGNWHRQVSLLSFEKIEAFREKMYVDFGAFGENLVVSGFDFAKLPVGIRFKCGDAVLRMTQIGKQCHNDCEIKRITGDCIMPREGVFAVVEKGGKVKTGDEFDLLYSVAVIVASDSASSGENKDLTGPMIKEIMENSGYYVSEVRVVSDDREELSKAMAEIADSGNAQLILTTGGTGLSPRDNTPEATLDIADKLVPGISEAMRAYSNTITPYGMLSRGVSAIRKRTLIVNLPGSPKAVKENLGVFLPAAPHALKTLVGAASNCANTERK